MATTVMAATEIEVIPPNFRGDGPLRMTMGRKALSSGTSELDTGLDVIEGFWATTTEPNSSDDTETVVYRIREDLPFSGGAVTVDGILLNETAAVADAVSEVYCWFAIGR